MARSCYTTFGMGDGTSGEWRQAGSNGGKHPSGVTACVTIAIFDLSSEKASASTQRVENIISISRDSQSCLSGRH